MARNTEFNAEARRTLRTIMSFECSAAWRLGVEMVGRNEKEFNAEARRREGR